MLHSSPLLKKACVRQVVSDEWFPLKTPCPSFLCPGLAGLRLLRAHVGAEALAAAVAEGGAGAHGPRPNRSAGQGHGTGRQGAGQEARWRGGWPAGLPPCHPATLGTLPHSLGSQGSQGWPGWPGQPSRQGAGAHKLRAESWEDAAEDAGEGAALDTVIWQTSNGITALLLWGRTKISDKQTSIRLELINMACCQDA